MTSTYTYSYTRTHTATHLTDVILGTIIESANDAAVVLAERLGGTESDFAEMMSRKARALGMTRSEFRNASGLNHPEQVVTARDMALLALALLADAERSLSVPLAVAFGVVFWAWGLVWYGPLQVIGELAFPLRDLFYAVWLVPAVLGPLIIRKPGAALFTERFSATARMRESLSPSCSPEGSTDMLEWFSSTRRDPPLPTAIGKSRRSCCTRNSSRLRRACLAK